MRHILLGVTTDRTRSAIEFAPEWVATDVGSHQTVATAISGGFSSGDGTLCPLLAENDVPATLLHDWEAYTVEKLGIGAYREKTPFPLERADRG